ncbi:MAG: AMP-binding protein, partial [Actinomycetes bacterium]
MAEHLARAVRQLLLDADRPIEQIDLVAAEERRQLIHQGKNPAPRDRPPARHEAIRQQAQRHPDRLALVCGARRLSYGELETRANQLANLLIDRGIGPDVPVAVCLPPGVDLVVSLLAVIKAGGCYVPLDPQLPADRVTFMLADADVALTIAAAQVPGIGAWATSGRPVIRLDSAADRHAISSRASTLALDPVGPDRLGYILYTSGSTGVPKGVAVLESAVANLLRAVTRFVPVQPGEAALFTSAATFDISTVEIFLPLLSGGHVVIATRDQARTPNDLVRLIDQHEVCLAQATPSAWRYLAEALAPGGRRDRLQVITAGETLPGDLAARLCEVAGRVVNGYGPTETTIYSTMTEIAHPGGDI